MRSVLGYSAQDILRPAGEGGELGEDLPLVRACEPAAQMVDDAIVDGVSADEEQRLVDVPGDGPNSPEGPGAYVSEDHLPVACLQRPAGSAGVVDGPGGHLVR